MTTHRTHTSANSDLPRCRRQQAWRHTMKVRLSRRMSTSVVAVFTVAAGSVTWMAMGASAAPKDVPHGGAVLQTNLVSDLPATAAVTDPNLVNPWGLSSSSGSPFWASDNNAGVATLYQVPGASNAPVSINPLAVNIPTPVGPTGGTPTGTVFNLAAGAFKVAGQNKSGQAASASAAFLFATEDGTITGWNPGIDPTGKFAGPAGA